MESGPPKAGSTLDDLMKAIMTAAEKPSADDGRHLCELVWKLGSRARKNPDARTAAATGRTAIILHRILKGRTGVPGMARNILEALCGLEGFGRMIAGRHVRSGSVSANEFSALLPSLPVGTRLDIADELLIEGIEEMPRGAKETADQIVGSIDKEDAPEVAAWLARAGAKGLVVSHPLTMSMGKLTAGISMNAVQSAQVALGLGGHGLDTIQLENFEQALGEDDVGMDLLTAADRILPASHPLRKKLFRPATRLGGDVGRYALATFAASSLKATGKAVARYYAARPAPATAASTVLLPPAELADCIRSLPSPQRTKAVSEAFAAASATTPRELMAALAKESGKAPIMSERLKKIITQTANSQRLKIKPLPQCRTTPPTSSGSITRIFTEGRLHKLAKILAGGKISGPELPEQIVQDARTLQFSKKGLSCPDSTFLKSGFEHCTFDSWNLARSHFHRCIFEQCTFKRCILDECRFNQCTFKGCTFEDCDMGFLSQRDCIWNQNDIYSSDMHSMQTHGCTFARNNWRETNLKGSQLRENRFHACRLRHSALGHSLLIHCSFKGMECIRCSLFATHFEHCDFLRTEFTECAYNDLIVTGTEIAVPLLLKSWLNTVLNRLCATPSTGTQISLGEEEVSMAARALLRLSRHIDFIRREYRMLANDARRHTAALRKLTPDQRDLMIMLPDMFRDNRFELHSGKIPPTPCKVRRVVPTFSSESAMTDLFGEPPAERLDRSIKITGIFAMGSMGSLAQTPSSDLDCWLIIKPGTADEQLLQNLTQKCRAIEEWAWKELSLETHFFIMDEDDVRANRFGLSDSESSGSAQAILLKEEFYRTALKITGDHPTWWLSTPGCSSKEYASTALQTREHPLGGKPRMLDLGPLGSIPPGEYFGAALWQMIKAIHSPFKSVMKLGLLDRYAAHTDRLPLADQIKQRLFDGDGTSARVDPYAAMYLELKALYAERDDQEGTLLITESFLLKADLSSLPYFRNLPASREAQSLVELLFGSGYVAPEIVTCDEAPWTFAQSLEAGTSVSRFMTSAYGRIREMIAKSGTTDTMITPEDLTRLGRRIVANFSHKPHKVARVPFLDVGTDQFSVLRFTATKAQGKATRWHIRGAQAIEGKTSSRNMQEIMQHSEPAMLPAWLVANKLYSSHVLVEADRSIAPLSATDLQRLLAQMYEFFPYETTFEGDLDENLKSETVTRAFLIANLDEQLETRTLESIAVVYATNWGELFCKTFRNPDSVIIDHAGGFLEDKLDQPVASDVEMALFMPKGAQCPRIMLV